jgi:dipeptidyl aminopeptidase/acylaminoacyl peptidase
MSKIAYIIPGHGESALKQRVYKKVGTMFESRGIKPVYVEIDWQYHNPARFKDFVAQFLKQYKKKKGDEVYVLGFSYGATITFLSESKTKPAGLILCSLSPYFSEDVEGFKPAWVKWWKKNFTESDYSFAKLAPKIKTPTSFLVGSEEGTGWGDSVKRAKDGKKLISNSTLKVIKGAKHNIRQKEYLEALEKFISKL